MKDARAWWIAYGACAVAALAPLVTTYRLPMADLPQHAVQLTIWKYYTDPCYQFAQQYFINWATPYLVGVAFMHAIAAFMSVPAALKTVVYLTILALPIVMRRLTDYARIDPFLALLGFPLSFGFSFYWGFINFSFAVPLLLLLLLYACKAADGSGGALPIAIAAIAVAAAHGLLYAIALLMIAPMLVFLIIKRRPLWRALIALFLPVPALALWFFTAQAANTRARAPIHWLLIPVRPLQLLDFALSAGLDPGALGFSAVLLVIAILAGFAPANERWKWIPAGAAVAGFVFGPFGAAGQTFLYPRLALIAWTSAVVALRPRSPFVPRRTVRGLIVAASLTWMIVLAFRFSAFDRDADGFDTLVDTMPSNQRVLLLNTFQSSDVEGMPFLHFAGYYFERKGGAIGWNFANNFPAVVRYRPAFSRGVPPIIAEDPRLFVWRRDSDFDFFIVRAPVDVTPLIFRDAGNAVRLRERVGNWWLYEKTSRQRRPDCAPIARDGDHRPLLNPG